MQYVDKFKTLNNNYEFMMTYPASTTTLPSGYTYLEYIETSAIDGATVNTTGAYIDTNFIPNGNTAINLTCSVSTIENNKFYAFSAANTTNNDGKRFESYPWDGEFEFRYGDNRQTTGIIQALNLSNIIRIVQYKNNYKLYIDNIKIIDDYHSPDTIVVTDNSIGRNLWIFGLNRQKNARKGVTS
jgi:hypothetical protein